MGTVNMGTLTLVVEITPCLLGFNVTTYNVSSCLPGSGFRRHVGLFSSFGELCKQLMFTEGSFKVVLR